MERKCLTCEHLNGANLTEWEVCGTTRNLYAEEAFEHKEAIKKLEIQVRTLKGSLTKTRNERDALINQISEKAYEVEKMYSDLYEKNIEIKSLKKNELDLLKNLKVYEGQLSENKAKLASLNKEIKKNEKIILGKEDEHNALNSRLSHLRNSVRVVANNLKKAYFFLCFIVLTSATLVAYFYYNNQANKNEIEIINSQLIRIRQDSTKLKNNLITATANLKRLYKDKPFIINSIDFANSKYPSNYTNSFKYSDVRYISPRIKITPFADQLDKDIFIKYIESLHGIAASRACCIRSTARRTR